MEAELARTQAQPASADRGHQGGRAWRLGQGRDRTTRAETERDRGEARGCTGAEAAPSSNLAELYRRKVAALADALNAETMRSEATAAMRGLIEEIRLAPADGKLRIELFGELAALSHWQAAVVLESNTPGRAVRGCKLRWLRGEDLNL